MDMMCGNAWEVEGMGCAEAATVKRIQIMKGVKRGIEKQKMVLKERQMSSAKKEGEIEIRTKYYIFHIIPNTSYRKLPLN